MFPLACTFRNEEVEMEWIQALLNAAPADFARKPLEPTAPGNRVLGPLDGDAERAFWAVEYQLAAINGEIDAHGKLHENPEHNPDDCVAFHEALEPKVARAKLLEKVLLEELSFRYGGQLKPEERFAVTADGVVAVSEVPEFVRQLAEALGTSPQVDRTPGMLEISVAGSIPADAPEEKRRSVIDKLLGR
jgi:hypothetical protein